MKTQILSIAILFTFFIYNDARATETTNGTANLEADISLNDLSAENSFETDLAVEDWMTDDELWSNTQLDIDDVVTVEMTMDLEPWMNDDEIFHIYQELLGTEKELKVTDWMTNDHYWRL